MVHGTRGTALVGPKGILDETVATGQNLVCSNGLTYQTLSMQKQTSHIYEDGAVWFMTKKTYGVRRYGR